MALSPEPMGSILDSLTLPVRPPRLPPSSVLPISSSPAPGSPDTPSGKTGKPSRSRGLLSRLFFRLRGRKSSSGPSEQPPVAQQQVAELRRYTYKELQRATEGFRWVIGKGSYGSVYKGLIESHDVAVKKFDPRFLPREDELVRELSLLSRLRHVNVIRILGWCREENCFLIVYEHIVNGDLASFIYPPSATSEEPPKFLPWEARYNKVVLGLANALAFMQTELETCLVHRDIKANNILLDSEFNPKLSDFDLARLYQPNEESMMTSVVMGTRSNLSPEYISLGQYGKKSDIYAFGVVVLEVACGRRISSRPLLENKEGNLLAWVRKLYSTGEILKAADPSLRDLFVGDEMKRLLLVGLWCTELDPKARPAITQILKALRFQSPLPSSYSRHQDNAQAGAIMPRFSEFVDDGDDKTICIRPSARRAAGRATADATSSHDSFDEQEQGSGQTEPPQRPLVAVHGSAVAEEIDMGEFEEFDIGIPDGYSAIASSCVEEHHHPIIEGLSASIRRMLLAKDEPPAFDVLLESIRNYTGFLAKLRVPLDDWNSLAQLVLRASKQVPSDLFRALASSEPDAAAAATSLFAEMKDCARAVDEDGAQIDWISECLCSALQDRALLLDKLADLQKQIQEANDLCASIENEAEVLCQRRASHEAALDEKKKKYAGVQLFRLAVSKLSSFKPEK